MALKTTRYDTADYLDSPEAMAAYIDAVLEDGDPTLFNHALGVVARAHGMTRVARDTGLSRESLYRALDADGNPEFATVVRVLKALGLRLTAIPSDETSHAPSR